MSIRQDLYRGILYTALAKYSGIFVQLLVTAILARLLTPEDFAIVAIATVIINFFDILSDIGIGPAIVQIKELTEIDINNIYSVTMVMGIAFAGLFFLSAIPISNYYNEANLIDICRWFSIPILFHCLSIVPKNLLYKDKNFKRVAYVSLLSQTIAGIFSVFAAAMGAGLYALVLSQIVSSLLLYILFFLSHKVSVHFSGIRSSLGKILSFSIYQFLFNLINYFSRNLDKLLIGKYIGMAPLGYYEKSYRLMILPLQNITQVISPVMHPVLSSLQNDKKELSSKYLSILNLLGYLAFTLSALLFFSSKEIVLLVFGNQWQGAVLPFRILSITVGFQILTSTAGAIYQSANATKQLFISGCWCAFFMISSFVVSIFFFHSIEAVSIGYVIAQFFNTLQCFILLFKTLKCKIVLLVKALYKPIIAGAGVFVSLFFFSELNFIDSLIMSLIMKTCLFVIIALFITQLLGEYRALDIIHLLSVKNKK